MDGVSRRGFLIDAARTMLAYSLVELCRPGGALAASDTAFERWVARVQGLSSDLSDGRATTHAWRRRMPRFTRRVPLDALRRAVDLDAAVPRLRTLVDPEPQERRSLPLPSGLEHVNFTAILSYVREGFAVVPHGHHNMVSMHLVLDGALHLRQYDRVREEPGSLVIRPVADRVCRPGETTAISADRGNVHWFQGLTDSYALIVAAYDLDPGAGAARRDYVDPVGGEVLSDRSIRAPILTVDEARQRYLTF